jgi:hypothetical protein
MNVAKIAISIDPGLLGRVDSLVRAKRFRGRSELFQVAACHPSDLARVVRGLNEVVSEPRA